VSDVTQILDRAQQGDPKAAEELLPLVYEELHKLAAHRMAGEAAGHTLQPTALVHEATNSRSSGYRRCAGRMPEIRFGCGSAALRHLPLLAPFPPVQPNGRS